MKEKKRRAGEANGGGLATREKLKGKAYEAELEQLHVELVKLQEWVKHKGLKVCIVFEGRDGAGKGGAIKAITERVSPRVFRVVALPAPTSREKSQMYLQRYVPHLPAAGEGRRHGGRAALGVGNRKLAPTPMDAAGAARAPGAPAPGR